VRDHVELVGYPPLPACAAYARAGSAEGSRPPRHCAGARHRASPQGCACGQAARRSRERARCSPASTFRSTTSPRGSEAGRNSAATSGKPWPIAQLPSLASRTFRAECRLVRRSRRRFRARSEPILPGCRHDRPGLEHGAKNLERDRSPGAGHLAGTCRPAARSPPSGECRLGRRVTDSSRRFVSPRLTLTRNGNFSITQPPTNREVNSTC